MATMEDCVKFLIYVKQLQYFALLTLGVDQNFFVLFFKLMVAKFFLSQWGSHPRFWLWQT